MLIIRALYVICAFLVGTQITTFTSILSNFDANMKKFNIVLWIEDDSVTYEDTFTEIRNNDTNTSNHSIVFKVDIPRNLVTVLRKETLMNNDKTSEDIYSVPNQTTPDENENGDGTVLYKNHSQDYSQENDIQKDGDLIALSSNIQGKPCDFQMLYHCLIDWILPDIETDHHGDRFEGVKVTHVSFSRCNQSNCILRRLAIIDIITGEDNKSKTTNLVSKSKENNRKTAKATSNSQSDVQIATPEKPSSILKTCLLCVPFWIVGCGVLLLIQLYLIKRFYNSTKTNENDLVLKRRVDKLNRTVNSLQSQLTVMFESLADVYSGVETLITARLSDTVTLQQQQLAVLQHTGSRYENTDGEDRLREIPREFRYDQLNMLNLIIKMLTDTIQIHKLIRNLYLMGLTTFQKLTSEDLEA